MSVNIKIENNEDIIPNIEQLVKNVSDSLDEMNIDLDTSELSIPQCITIISLISKGASEISELVNYFKDMDPEKKTSAIFNITTQVLAHPDINKKLSPTVNQQLKDFANNKEILDMISSLLNWTSSRVLNSLDNDNNGIVTIKEIEDDFVNYWTGKFTNESEGYQCYREDGCCHSSVKIVRVIGNLWAKFFIKILCCKCSENTIELNK